MFISKLVAKSEFLGRSVSADLRIALPISLSCRLGKSLLTALAFTLIVSGSAMAAGSPASDLDKLELKFFHHTYPKEDQVQRLDRLEKMFFGEAKEGSANERLSNLRELVQAVGRAAELVQSAGLGGWGAGEAAEDGEDRVVV